MYAWGLRKLEKERKKGGRKKSKSKLSVFLLFSFVSPCVLIACVVNKLTV